MQVQRSIAALALVGALVAACGGNAATQGPGAATQGPGGDGPGAATQGPGAATQAPGGGGGSKPAGWDQYGKASYEISAPLSLSGELGFVPAASRFDGTQTTSLAFANDGVSEVLTILFTEGKAVISYGSEAGTVVGSNCTTSNVSIQQSSASGSFECTEVLAMMASGAQVQNVTLKGTFNGHG